LDDVAHITIHLLDADEDLVAGRGAFFGSVVFALLAGWQRGGGDPAAAADGGGLAVYKTFTIFRSHLCFAYGNGSGMRLLPASGFCTNNTKE